MRRTAMPGVVGILETSLYVANVQSSVAFYQSIFDFPLLLNTERIATFRVADGQVLLLFKIGGSIAPMTSSEGTIPPHDATALTHIAFSIATADFDGGQTWLAEHNIATQRTLNSDTRPRPPH